MASHAGVLAALDEVAGIDPDRADLVIGTSAGSVIGALVRSGWRPREIWALATRSALPDGRLHDVGRPDLFHRSWANPVQLARRSLGSAYVTGRSLVRVPGVPVVPMPGVVRRAFPGGFLAVRDDVADELAPALPDAWPERGLWICTVDIESGRRIVIGRDGREMPLSQAVLASSAIPGYFEPVRHGRRTLVDGGVHSTTNLDLALRGGPALVIASAPMGYDPTSAPGSVARAVRRGTNRSLARERLAAHAPQTELVVLRPGRAELAAHGWNPMRTSDLESVAVEAYAATARRLGNPDARRRLRAALDGSGDASDTGGTDLAGVG